MRVEIWGLAAGRNSTKKAAPGAFTWRIYPTESHARTAKTKGDWLSIVSEQKH